jgi:CDGSH-type Zn-finger protein/uncharacterized Fe-S cluster protein YjdI
MTKEVVRGRAVAIEFDGDRCIHSRHCVLHRPDVFVPNVEGEWIRPDAATPDDVVGIAANCPSGAIVARRLDGGPDEAAPLVNTVRVLENGPLAVRATLQFRGVSAGFRATLCRCGASKNKPYCDGSHAAAGFQATGEPATKPSEPLATRGGLLNVEPQPNGPLKLSGPVEIVSGTGRTVDRTTEAWLCRCGHSKNKPYCDGTHRKIGFQAD